MTNCAKCGSEKVIPGLTIMDQAGHYIRLGVNVYDHPENLLFKGKHTGLLRSQVCGECGSVESFVDNPQELYTAYLATQQTDQ